jgi:phosphoglycerate dehydrogenase-like enzyme
VRRVVFNMQDERPVWAPPAWVAQQLRAALPPGFELVEVSAPVSGRGDGGGVTGEALAAVRGAEVCLGLGLPRELLLAALEGTPRLRWFHTGAAGVASLLHPELRGAGVTLTNSAGVHAPAISETVLGAMLHFARGLDHAVAAQRRGEWDPRPWERPDSGVRELGDATLGIVGFGGIGRALAARAGALGMRVLAARRSAGDTRSAAGAGGAGSAGSSGSAAPHAAAAGDAGVGDVTVLHGPGAVDRIFSDSDFVVLTVPSTPQTRGLADAFRLGRLRPGAVLVNVARGDVVDEEALLHALREGRIRGAALDVFTVEPLPADSPLWQLDNVLITPHVSATTPRYWEREAELIVDNLRRYGAGLPLRNVVDIEAGY